VKNFIIKYQVFFKHLFSWIITIYLIKIAGIFPGFIEMVYARNIYPVIAVINRWLARFFPFSIGDLIYFWGIAYLIFQFIRLLIHFKKPGKQFIVISNFLLKTVWIFYLSWGLNYFRQPLSEILHLQETNYTMEQLQSVTDSLIARSNRLQIQLSGNDTLPVRVPYALERILNKAPEGYKAIENILGISYKVPCLKTSLFSKQISYMHVSGYLNPFTGEAQINKFYPKVFLPDIVSHEIAHQLGFAPENEANFLGYLASIHHNDLFFNYAGNIDALYYFLVELKKADKNVFTAYVKKINKGILKNFKEGNEFNKKYRFPIDFSTGYDTYLKLNKQTSGIRSYNEMVKLVIAYELRNNKITN
jgi:hypothetical protein